MTIIGRILAAGLAALILAGCGRPLGIQTGSVCDPAPSAASIPRSLLPRFRLPAGMAIQEVTTAADGRTVQVRGQAQAEFQLGFHQLADALSQAGYNVVGREAEAAEAEALFLSKQATGRVIVNALGGCPNTSSFLLIVVPSPPASKKP